MGRDGAYVTMASVVPHAGLICVREIGVMEVGAIRSLEDTPVAVPSVGAASTVKSICVTRHLVGVEAVRGWRQGISALVLATSLPSAAQSVPIHVHRTRVAP